MDNLSQPKEEIIYFYVISFLKHQLSEEGIHVFNHYSLTHQVYI